MAALLLESIALIQWYFSRKGLLEEATRRAESELAMNRLEIEKITGNVEAAARNTSWLLEYGLDRPDLVWNILRQLMENNPDVKDVGVAYVADYFPSQGRWLSYFRDRLRLEMPVDLFAVMLGTNDLLGTLKPDAEKTAQDMDALITCVKSLAIPQILLIAPPRISLTDLSFEASYVQGDRSYAQRYEEEGRELTRLYRELASRRGILFADASAWDLDFAFDAVHLSEKGHAVFGREMIRVMQAVQNGS